MKTNYTEIDIKTIQAWLKENLNEERYLHSLGAMDSAIYLAKKFNLNEERAAIAGLIHDCAKCLPKEELLNLLKNECKNYHPTELLNPKTWHAPVGAYLAENKFGITDKEILSSIRWHTLGKVEMSDFEKIIFIADKIEKNTREPEYRQKIETTLEKHNCLNKTLLKCFKLTIKSLMKRELTICQQTIDVYNTLIMQTNN